MPTQEDIDEARKFLRRIEQKKVYGACRSYLPSLLRRTHPKLYEDLMSQLKEEYGGTIDTKVEEGLQNLPSIEGFAKTAKEIRRRISSRRRARREGLDYALCPNCGYPLTIALIEKEGEAGCPNCCAALKLKKVDQRVEVTQI